MLGAALHASSSPGRRVVLRAAWAASSAQEYVSAASSRRPRSWPLTRAVTAPPPGSSSSVTSAGPIESAKSLLFDGPKPEARSARSRSRAVQSFASVTPPIAPSAPITAATAETRVELASSPPETARPRRARTRARVAEREERRLVALGRAEHAHARRVQHGGPKLDVVERVLRVLAGAAASREEGFERLCRELDDAIAVDPTRPAALELGALGAEHAEFHGSVWTITSAISGCSRRMSSSIALACACASSSRHWPSRPSVRKATRPTSVRRNRSSRGGRPVASRHDALDRVGVDALLARLRGLGQRLEVRLHGVELRHGGEDRVLELLGHVVRCLEGHVARQLQMQRQLEASPEVDEGEVVDLAYPRHGQRGRVGALAHARILERLDVDDDVAAGKGALERLLDGIGRGVPLSRPRRSARRR